MFVTIKSILLLLQYDVVIIIETTVIFFLTDFHLDRFVDDVEKRAIMIRLKYHFADDKVIKRQPSSPVFAACP